MSLAPIVLFVYNRPAHTQRTIAALQANDLAEDSHLIVYADGPKNHDDETPVGEVRDFIRNLKTFKSVTLHERPSHLGLAGNIVGGVNDTFHHAENIIVLEDDILTSQHFLHYMNNALKVYAKVPRVMHLSGYMVPINLQNMGHTVFTRIMYCWGWGTWKNRWQYFNRDSDSLIDAFDASMIHTFNLSGSENIWQQVLDNHSGRIQTWAVFWYASIFRRKGLCLNPARSYTHNFGNDGSGTHKTSTRRFQTIPNSDLIPVELEPAVPSPAIEKRISTFYRTKNRFHSKLIDDFRSRLDRLIRPYAE